MFIFLLAMSLCLKVFAMDGFTQAKRKGSARMLQRFVQVCLIRGEVALAKKIFGLACRYAIL